MSEESNCTLEFLEPTSSTMSDFDPHSIVLPTNQVARKTYYMKNLIEKIESPTSQSAPTPDSKPHRDQGMENLIEPCTNRKMRENDRFDVVLENMEEKNSGDKSEGEQKPVIMKLNRVIQGNLMKYDPSLDIPTH